MRTGWRSTLNTAGRHNGSVGRRQLHMHSPESIFLAPQHRFGDQQLPIAFTITLTAAITTAVTVTVGSKSNPNGPQCPLFNDAIARRVVSRPMPHPGHLVYRIHAHRHAEERLVQQRHA